MYSPQEQNVNKRLHWKREKSSCVNVHVHLPIRHGQNIVLFIIYVYLTATDHSILVLLDLSAAFDTVDHATCINKQNWIGITGSAHKLFSSTYQIDTSEFILISVCPHLHC